MKNLKMFAIGLVAMIAAIPSVLALNVSDADSLDACITLGGECTLADDITVDDADSYDLIAYEKKVVIDLGGHTLTLAKGSYITVMEGGELAIKNGTVIQKFKGDIAAFEVMGGTLKTEKLIIKVTGAVDNGDIPHAFWLSGEPGDVANLVVSADTTVTVTNGYGLVVSTSTNADLNGTWETGNSTITHDNFADKDTIVVINGGSYTSTSATNPTIDIKQGNFTINGGSFVSEKQDAVHIYSVKNQKNQTVKIAGGYFEAKNPNKSPIWADAITGFMTKGIFKKTTNSAFINAYPTYLAEGIKGVKTANGDILVGKPYKVTVGKLTVTANTTETSLGYTKPASFEAIEGEKVNLLAKFDLSKGINPKDLNYRYGVKYTITNASTKEVVTGLDEFTMPASDITIDLELAEVRKDAEVGEAKPTDVTPVDPSNTGDGTQTTDPGTTNPGVPNVPKTNDNILVYASLGVVSALSVGFSAKRKENN